jgi:translation initiation factor 3 subunit A
MEFNQNFRLLRVLLLVPTGAMKSLDDIEDLDASETPETLLLAMVSDEGTESRTKKVVLAPWVKFLWEAYRTVLDILKNNSKLEALYQEVAQNCFRFCLKFQRKMEFRRLCELLRKHVSDSQKYQQQINAVDLSSPETLQLYLETRFEQLNTAAKMEQWQEAFKAIEDISNLMQMSEKAPKPLMLAMYYQKLAMVLWKSQDYVFHAKAWSKLFMISIQQKKTFNADEAQFKASCVLLSTLSVPITNAGLDDKEQKRLTTAGDHSLFVIVASTKKISGWICGVATKRKSNPSGS